MNDEIQALRVEKHELANEVAIAHTHQEDMAGEIANLEAARARLTAALAQKSVELEEGLRARADLMRRLESEVKKEPSPEQRSE